jgi:membrane fusion protein (multidrug efflux system)
MILMLVVVLLVIGGIFGYRFHQFAEMGKAMAAMKQPPVAVSATEARADKWQPMLRTTGTIAAVQGVVLSNELAGVVEKIGFESGESVKKGALLVQLNTETEQAQLRSLQAATELARQNLERAKRLRESNVNAQADLDNSQAQFEQAVANVENIKAAIAKKSIVAPFSGKLGIRQINLGQYLPAGTPIVSLQSLDPIYVNFTLPQQDIRDVKVNQEVSLTVDAFPGATFQGKINAFDSKIDETTRTVRVQATFSNADGRLNPGMFGNVAVLLPAKSDVITVPQMAITYNPYGDVVYVVEPAKSKDGQPQLDEKGQPELTVRQQFVKVGETRGDQVSILSGLKAGDRVVTAGQLKLRNGVTIQINNSVPVANNPSPNPPNT